MNPFKKIFQKTKTQQQEQEPAKKHLSKEETEQRNKEFMARFEQVKNLFISSLAAYNAENCPCAYPRFQQIIGIDCRDTGNSFKCFETDLLINLSKAGFDIEKSQLTDECTNEKWTCRKCGSTYEYGWSDFSIYVERQKLKLVHLAASPKGKPAVHPIPLYLGLMGHSYPSKTEITSVDFGAFENYLTEK